MIKKYFSFFIFLLFPTILFAVGNAPQTGVWITPATAKASEQIILNAFVYNSTPEDVTVTVAFNAGEKTISTSTLSIPTLSAKTATAKWTMPKDEVVLTASITKAIDGKKQAVPELVGTIGTISVGGGSDDPLLRDSSSTIKGWFNGIIAWIEPFRIKYAEYFVSMRDEAKATIGIAVGEDIGTLLTPKQPEPPAIPGEEKTTVGDLSVESASDVHFAAYFKLIYATALAALFTHVAVFYIVLVLLLLMILRFVLRMFS